MKGNIKVTTYIEYKATKHKAKNQRLCKETISGSYMYYFLKFQEGGMK